MLKQSLSDIVSKFEVNVLIRTGITAFLQNVLSVSISPLAACFHPPDKVVQNKQTPPFCPVLPHFSIFFHNFSEQDYFINV